MAKRIGDLLAARADESFVGREDELALLLGMLDQDQPPVWYLHAIGGTGKTRLLEKFAGRARQRGARVVNLDCRTIEPTARAFMREIGAVTGEDLASVEGTADVIGRLGSRVVVILDSYEVFWLLDSWLRQEFIPALPDHVRIVMASREAPPPAWAAAPGWDGLFQSVPLSALPDRDALELLRRSGIEGELAQRIVRISGGCPMALRLAIIIAGEQLDAALEGAALCRLYEELMGIYISYIKDARTLNALEAASVVRRVTRPLLVAMLKDEGAEAFDRLLQLSWVEHDRDGLFFHGTIQAAIAMRLRANNPDRHREYRRAAWRHLREQARGAGAAEIWRHTADLLFLIETAPIREAFFPIGPRRHVVEAALPADGEAIREITALHCGPATVRLVDAWWQRAPECFRVVREPNGTVAGFCPIVTDDALPPDLAQSDPFLHAWRSHLRREPVGRQQRVLFAVVALSREHGQAPSDVLSAIWLDVKCRYMEMRPHLRRIYIAQSELTLVDAAHRALGFRWLRDRDVTLDERRHHTLMLDFGPASVDGWLSALIAAELGMDDDGILDTKARELVMDGRRVGLTRLEFDVMNYLAQREDEAVPRADLLSDVWGYDYDGGSNVVDVVVRSLRKKLGERATVIEAVRGTGYRLRAG